MSKTRIHVIAGLGLITLAAGAVAVVFWPKVQNVAGDLKEGPT